jgi:hypothetical protein
MLEGLRAALWRARDATRDYLRPGHRREVFTKIAEENLWGCDESRSGAGSTHEAAAAIVEALPGLWKRYGIHSLIDAPCGDCHWIASIAMSLDRYVGVDIVPALIESNRAKYPTLNFTCADLTRDTLPEADAILCRDCFQHLPTRLIQSALRNFKASGARWLLATTNRNADQYKDIAIGSSRPINLQLPPFNLPEPVALIAEGSDGRYLALWSLDR